jgi:hypothetical protein
MDDIDKLINEANNKLESSNDQTTSISPKFNVGDIVKVINVTSDICIPEMKHTLHRMGVIKNFATFAKKRTYNVSVEGFSKYYVYYETDLAPVSIVKDDYDFDDDYEKMLIEHSNEELPKERLLPIFKPHEYYSAVKVNGKNMQRTPELDKLIILGII